MTWLAVPVERRYVIMGAVARVLLKQATVSADDLHGELAPDEYPWDRRAFGAVLRGMVSRGVLEPVSYRASKRRECHGRPIMDFKEAKK